MSFILDALRKSEHARQQQTGPGLAEIPVVPARPRSNAWATAAVALLIVNLVGVGVLLVRRANKEEAASPAAASATAASANTSNPAPTPVVTPSVNPVSAAAPAPLASAPPAPAPLAAGRNSLAEEVEGDATALDPTLAAGAANVPSGPPAVTRAPSGSTRRGSVVYAPIPEASGLPAPQAAPATRQAPAAGADLPNADEVAARGAVPELHLDLHVYSPSPQQRFIFVNSRKYREGETLQEGPVVEQITADGAVLSYGGSRFKLTSD